MRSPLEMKTNLSSFHWYMAIICNVSNIARKPAVDNLEDKQQDSDQTNTNVQIDGATDGDIEAAMIDQRSDTCDKGPTAKEHHPPKQTNDDEDANLFEEEKLNLIDRDDEGVDKNYQITNKQGRCKQTLPSVLAAPVSAMNSEVPSTDLLSDLLRSPKKKGKRRQALLKRDPTKPVIVVLDSLSHPHSNATRALREWLQAEGFEKRGLHVEIDNKGYYAKPAQIPTQDNLSDCGLYVLGYARQFFKNPDEFKTKLLTGEMSAENDWPDMQPTKMRCVLRNLIFALHADQEETRKVKRPTSARNTPKSLAKAGFKEASPMVQQSDSTEPDTLTIVQAGTSQRHSPKMTEPKDGTPPAAFPRLGFPSDLRAQTGNTRSSAAEELVKDTGSNSSPTATTPTRPTATAFMQSKPTPGQRLGNPEVRIPVKSPHVDTSSYVRYDGATDQPHESQQPTDLTSPLHRHELRNQDKGRLRTLSAKRNSANSIVHPTCGPTASLNPSQPHARLGSHHDPIMLDDSQELNTNGKKLPTSTNKHLTETIELDLSQEIVSSTTHRNKDTSDNSSVQHKVHLQMLQHDSSLGEQIEYNWKEGQNATTILKASLGDKREVQQEFHDASESLDCTMDDVDYAQAAVSQPHSMQTANVEDKAQGYEVAETPEQQRNSPVVGGNELNW